MSERWEQLTFLGSFSSAGASHVRTSAAQVAELASPPEPAPDSGSNSTESSASSCPSGSSSKTSRRGPRGGCPVCGTTCGLGATEPVHSRFLPPTSGRLNSGDGSSLWATPIASDAKRAALTPGAAQAQSSLTQAVCSALWPTPMDRHIDGPHASETRKGGRSTQVLNPAFVEALMGFPAGWTVLD